MHTMSASSFSIVPTTTTDAPFIYTLFEDAIAYIQQHNYAGWSTYDKAFILRDIARQLQFKIVSGNSILCVFSICYTDPLIWRHLEKGDAIYLHRIVVNPQFKGQQQFARVLQWATLQARQKGLTYIRMDTWAANPKIIEYYKSYGFTHVENYTTPNTPQLPMQHRNLTVALLQHIL